MTRPNSVLMSLGVERMRPQVDFFFSPRDYHVTLENYGVQNILYMYKLDSKLVLLVPNRSISLLGQSTLLPICLRKTSGLDMFGELLREGQLSRGRDALRFTLMACQGNFRACFYTVPRSRRRCQEHLDITLFEFACLDNDSATPYVWPATSMQH